VTSLVARDVVNTMPEATLRAVADHGQIPADSMDSHYQEAQQVLDDLQLLGIDYVDSMQGLEDAAVAKFEDSWAQLSEHLGETLRAQQSNMRG
jgi:transaldolase